MLTKLRLFYYKQTERWRFFDFTLKINLKVAFNRFRSKYEPIYLEIKLLFNQWYYFHHKKKVERFITEVIKSIRLR